MIALDQSNKGTSCDLDGNFSIQLSGNETYVTAANLTGANAITGSVTIDAGGAALNTSAGPYNLAIGGSWTNSPTELQWTLFT